MHNKTHVLSAPKPARGEGAGGGAVYRVPKPQNEKPTPESAPAGAGATAPQTHCFVARPRSTTTAPATITNTTASAIIGRFPPPSGCEDPADESGTDAGVAVGASSVAFGWGGTAVDASSVALGAGDGSRVTAAAVVRGAAVGVASTIGPLTPSCTSAS